MLIPSLTCLNPRKRSPGFRTHSTGFAKYLPSHLVRSSAASTRRRYNTEQPRSRIRECAGCCGELWIRGCWRYEEGVGRPDRDGFDGAGEKILAKEVKKRKAKQLIGATVLALVNYSDMEHHRKRKIPLEARDERFEERLDACAHVYLRLFATAIEHLGERAKPRTQHIVNFLVDIPDVLYNEGAIKRIQRVLKI